mmetsp:Transcript_19223/g.39726  ORF Transcript_19223/g.39726 Transcript_19223/m.39726 type:complete len:310 (-) Transcript_19223:375-1304(-)
MMSCFDQSYLSLSSIREIDRTLRIAAFEGDLDRVHHLVQLGADVNAGQSIGITPLLVAVSQAPVEISQYLLEQGANANVSSNGTTVLHVATVYGRLDVVRLLLRFGACPNTARKKDGTTPLMVAIELGYLQLTRCLLAHGASLDFRRTTDGYTALHLASGWNRAIMNGRTVFGDRDHDKTFYQIVCLLIERAYLAGGPKGADAAISKQAHCGRTPIHLACKQGHANIVQVLLLHCDSTKPSTDDPNYKKERLGILCKKKVNAIREAACHSVCSSEHDGKALLRASIHPRKNSSCISAAKGIFSCLRPAF